jgi:GntR family transcriptional regulator, transcriptional repressor for pyruvate dehydrogenase complex
MRQPRLAEMVAGVLRDRIVSGALADGDALPGVDKLVQEFAVSPPSLREALRILENEGLITVRRGNVGGAVVHRPTADSAAYMFGLVLQAERVEVADLAAAVGHLETLCARLCAARADRARAVMPQLHELQAEGERVIDDAVAFESSCQRFHDALISLSGNRSIEMTVGALGWLWRQQGAGWGHRVSELHEYPDPKLRKAGLAAHASILSAIERGDAEQAEALTRSHLDHQGIRKVSGSEAIVRATGVWRAQPPDALGAVYPYPGS